MKLRTLAAMLAAGLIVAGGAPGYAASRQAIYDDAQAALDRGDWATAADGFGRVLNPPGRETRSDGLVRTRYADALRQLGRYEEARAAAERAARELEGTGAKADAELANTFLGLGDILREELEMEPALAAYDRARAALPPGADPVPIEIGTILAAMVTAPDRAARAVDAVLASTANSKELPRSQQALLLALRGRAEINRGNPKGALPFLSRALTAAGPLTSSVTLAQAAVRADAALAYAILHDVEDARRYLAFTGAAYMPDMSWLTSSDNALPLCGEELRPDDVAVVEFAVGEDGAIRGVRPIYASRPGRPGVLFARAVREWHWQPRDLAKLDNFWRSSIRIEMRCASRPTPFAMSKPLYDAALAWAKERGATMADDPAPSDPAVTPRTATLVRLADVSQRAFGERKRTQAKVTPEEFDAALVAAGAPPVVRAVVARALFHAQAPAGGYGKASPREAAMFAQAIARIQPQAGSALAIAWLRTELALNLETGGNFAAAGPLLDAVLATPIRELDGHDPIRLVATLHRSLLDRRAGDAEAAQQRIARAGLDAAQCALFDVRPLPQSIAVSSATFPMEAMRWNMGGVVRESFDIAADGKVTDVRTVLAFPPFVFGEATEKAFARSRYLPPTFGGTVLGCSGSTTTVRFVRPN